MPHRDPETGKFTANEHDDYDRVEEQYFGLHLSVPASDVGGQTGQTFGQDGSFEGLLAYDAEVFLDRDEIGVMLWAEHNLVTGILSTQTADGTVSAILEVSAAGDRQVSAFAGASDIADASGDFTVETGNAIAGGEVNTGDLVGRPLHAIGYGPITDGNASLAGSGSAGEDEWVGSPAAEPVWDVRDSIFVNGIMEQSNVSDAALYAQIQGRHVFGVMEV